MVSAASPATPRITSLARLAAVRALAENAQHLAGLPRTPPGYPPHLPDAGAQVGQRVLPLLQGLESPVRHAGRLVCAPSARCVMAAARARPAVDDVGQPMARASSAPNGSSCRRSCPWHGFVRSDGKSHCAAVDQGTPQRRQNTPKIALLFHDPHVAPHCQFQPPGNGITANSRRQPVCSYCWQASIPGRHPASISLRCCGSPSADRPAPCRISQRVRIATQCAGLLSKSSNAFRMASAVGRSTALRWAGCWR